MNDKSQLQKKIQKCLLVILSILVVYLIAATVIVVAQASDHKQASESAKIAMLESAVQHLSTQVVALKNQNQQYMSVLEKHKLLAAATEEKLVDIALTANDYKQIADKQSSIAAEYKAQAQQLTNSVQKYEKLSKLDPELLKKYSKVYFLNENYQPTELQNIKSEYLLNIKKNIPFHAHAVPFLEQMLHEAAEAQNPLFVVSGYRSYREQQGLKSVYAMKFGTTTANNFSADQGYSEHQLGTTVDLTTREVNGPYESFAKTTQYQWLLDNAYKYGFVMSYPPKNNYYKYEPWHWRFVGTRLAIHLHDNKKNLIDLDQRTLDNYLAEIFD